MIAQPETVREFKPVYISTLHAEQYWVERSRANVADYITYLTDGVMSPANHHLEWLYAIFRPGARFVNIIAFPGSGKTTIISYAISWLIGERPDLTNIICSVSVDQAKDRLRTVLETIELNPRYHNVFPWINLDNKRPKNATSFTAWSTRWDHRAADTLDYAAWRSLIARYGHPKDHTLYATGITAKGLVGKRVSGIAMIDDPHDEQNSSTEEQRQKVVTFVRKTLIGRLVPGKTSRCVIISTRWAETDVSGRCAEEKRRDGTPVWETIVTPVQDEDGLPTWPQVWGQQDIKDRAEEVGGDDSPMFQLLYLNNAIGLASGEFDEAILSRPLPEPLPEIDELYISCDFARSESQLSDYSVYTAVARWADPTNPKLPFCVGVLDIERFKKRKIKDKIDNLVEFVDKIFGIYGKLNYVLIEEKDSDGEEQDIRAEYPDIPVKVVKTKGEKDTRLNAFAARAQLGRVYFNVHMKYYQAMKSELLSFPRGRHDDICDSLSLPFQLEGWRLRGRGRSGTKKINSPYLL